VQFFFLSQKIFVPRRSFNFLLPHGLHCFVPSKNGHEPPKNNNFRQSLILCLVHQPFFDKSKPLRPLHLCSGQASSHSKKEKKESKKGGTFKKQSKNREKNNPKIRESAVCLSFFSLLLEFEFGKGVRSWNL
ncbi:hypothetical protein AABB24_000654, partial [Solanum stoloniferum]